MGGREAEEERIIIIFMANSHCCMAETNITCKAIILLLKMKKKRIKNKTGDIHGGLEQAYVDYIQRGRQIQNMYLRNNQQQYLLITWIWII